MGVLRRWYDAMYDAPAPVPAAQAPRPPVPSRLRPPRAACAAALQQPHAPRVQSSCVAAAVVLCLARVVCSAWTPPCVAAQRYGRRRHLPWHQLHGSSAEQLRSQWLRHVATCAALVAADGAVSRRRRVSACATDTVGSRATAGLCRRGRRAFRRRQTAPAARRPSDAAARARAAPADRAHAASADARREQCSEVVRRAEAAEQSYQRQHLG